MVYKARIHLSLAAIKPRTIQLKSKGALPLAKVTIHVLLHSVLYALTRNKEHRATPYIHPMVRYALQIVHH